MPRAITDFLDEAVFFIPDKTAFIEEKRTITYKELQEEAYRIAMPIVQKGHFRSPMAIYLDRDISAIAAMHAVAYSGNFYSMIDVDMPIERINKILDILNPELVITDLNHLERAKQFADLDRLIVVDELKDSEIDADIINACRRNVLETDVLYVLFTSGSSGIPKGVVTPHRAVVNYIISLTDTYKVNNKTVIGNQIPFFWVMSVLDIYGAIAKKAQTFIIPKKLFMFPGRLVMEL